MNHQPDFYQMSRPELRKYVLSHREDDGILHAAPVAHSRGRQSGRWRHAADPGQHSRHDPGPALR